MGATSKVDKIRKLIDVKCEGKGVGLSAAFPVCATDDAGELHGCLETAVRCRLCLALNPADALNRNCDKFDDDAYNGSSAGAGSPSGAFLYMTSGVLD